MLNILAFILHLIDDYVFWIYLVCLFFILLNVRAYSRARQERSNTIFTIEKEVAAHKENRAMSSIGGILGLAVVVTLVKFYVVPSLDVGQVAQVSPTVTLFIPTRDFTTPTTALATETPTATARPAVTLRVATPTERAATPTPLPPVSTCPNDKARITSPGARAQVSGRVSVLGTANIDGFQFYKIEYSLGEEPGTWHVVGDLRKSPISNGLLGQIDTMVFPNGYCWIQLTVVDRTGNYPTPCRVRVLIQN